MSNCISPIVQLTKTKVPCLAPCGQCMPCRVNQRRAKANRILLEMKSHNHVAWLTLTYDEDHVRIDDNGMLTLCPQDMTNYLKRLRHYGLEFKYYYVGEYGSPEKTERPHYHAFLFGVDGSEPLLREQWHYGNVYVGANPKASQIAEYTASYVEKKLTKKKLRSEGDLRVPEFTRSSKNPAIGFNYAMQIAEKLAYAVQKIYKNSGNSITDEAIERLETGLSVCKHGQKSYPYDPWLKRKMVDRVRSICPYMFTKHVHEQKLRANFNAWALLPKDEYKRYQWEQFQKANLARKQNAKKQKI